MKGTGDAFGAATEDARAKVAASGASDVQGKKRRILVAEDNPINKKLVQKVLARLGWESAVAADGEQALTKLREDPEGYAAVLMDCQMPVIDGYAAARLIRHLDGAPFRSIPIIALTANVSEASEHEAQAAGMNKFLSEPLNYADHKSSLEKFVSR